LDGIGYGGYGMVGQCNRSAAMRKMAKVIEKYWDEVFSAAAMKRKYFWPLWQLG